MYSNFEWKTPVLGNKDMHMTTIIKNKFETPYGIYPVKQVLVLRSGRPFDIKKYYLKNSVYVDDLYKTTAEDTPVHYIKICMSTFKIQETVVERRIQSIICRHNALLHALVLEEKY